MGDDDDFAKESRAAYEDVMAAAEGRLDSDAWWGDDPKLAGRIDDDPPPMSSADKLNPNMSRDSVTGKVVSVSNPGDNSGSLLDEIQKRQIDAMNKGIDEQILTGVKASSGSWARKPVASQAHSKRIFDEVVETCSECRALVEPINMQSHKDWHSGITKTLDIMADKLRKIESAPTVRPRPREHQ